MSHPEDELLALSQKLLDAITAGDWKTYAGLCDPQITCFEPEAKGHLVAGLPFHKYYFDLPGGGDSPRQSTIAAPHVRVIGDTGIVCYVRLVQRLDAAGEPVTATANETRVWRRTTDGWKHIHFHRSPV
jgi:ketosteroid isomerase-like protein